MIREQNSFRLFMLRIRNFLIKDFFKTIHSIPRGVLYSTCLLIAHYFQIFSFSFGNLKSLSYGQTEISLLFQKLCVYTKIFPLLTLISGVSENFSFKIWLIFSLVLNISWLTLVLIQGILSERKEYRFKQEFLIFTTLVFQFYHWILFLPFIQVSCEFLFNNNSDIAFLGLGTINLLLTVGIGLLNQRFETSYFFKTTDFLERRPSFYFYASYACKIGVIIIYALNVKPDINIWSHFFLSWLLILESVEKFSFINFLTMQVYSSLSCIYAYLIIANILLYYLNQSNIKTFDLAFSILICMPILIKISLNIYDYIHQKCLMLNLEKITNVTILDQAVRVLYYNLKHCKRDKHSLLQIESWVVDHIRTCSDPFCMCKPFINKNPNFDQSILLKKKLTKLILGRTLEKALKTASGENNNYLHFIYLGFLLQILKIPTKSFAECLILNEKSKKFGLGDRIFTEIFLGQALNFFEKNLVQNKLKNQSLNFLKLIKFEENYLKLYENLVKLLMEYIEFYGLMCQTLIDLNELEAKINYLIKSRNLIDLNLNELVKMNPKSASLNELSVIFYFYLFPINQLERQIKEKDLLINKELITKKSSFDLFNIDAAVVSITLLKHYGVIRSHSRNFSKMLKYDSLVHENIDRVMPKIFSDVHTSILQRFIAEGRYGVTIDEYRMFFAMDKQNYVFPIRLQVKIDLFGNEDFGATGFMVPINQKFSYVLSSEDGRVLNISQRMFEKAFFRLVNDASGKNLARINLGVCFPALLFKFYGSSEESLYEDVFDTIFVSPKSTHADEMRLFTEDFSEEAEYQSVKSFSKDAKTLRSSVSRLTNRKDKSHILDKLRKLQRFHTNKLRLYSSKIKTTIYKYQPNELSFLIIEIQKMSGIHKNKQKIYEKYIQKLITSYEESEKADVKLFTTTQVSSLGLFADQGFIFRDSMESIRSSLIPEKDKDVAIGVMTIQNTGNENDQSREPSQSRIEVASGMEIQSENNNLQEKNQENPKKYDNSNTLSVEIKPSLSLADNEKQISSEKERIEKELLENLKEKTFKVPARDIPASHDFISSAKHFLNLKERMAPYNQDSGFVNPPMLKRNKDGDEIRIATTEDILGLTTLDKIIQDREKTVVETKTKTTVLSEIKEEDPNISNETKVKNSKDLLDLTETKEGDSKMAKDRKAKNTKDLLDLSEIKEEEKKLTTENEEGKEVSNEFILYDHDEENENKEEDKENKAKDDKNKTTPYEKQEFSPITEKYTQNKENREKNISQKKIEKKKRLKTEKTARDEKKMKIVESIASSSENSTTTVLKKNFLHLIKSKSLPLSLKVISMLGLLGFIGLAITFSILYSLLYQNFKDLNENLINIMFGHHFARPLGFVMKGIEQKIILENYYPFMKDKSSHYNSLQTLMEALNDYEYSYLQLINMNVKFQYQNLFMETQMRLKLYNLDQDPTQINLVLIHAFGLFIEHLRMCLNQNGLTLIERGNDAYYFLYQNTIELMNQMLEINVSTAQEANTQLENIKSMIIIFLVVGELVVFFISIIILPIFLQVNQRKEESLVLFCSFQQDVLINKISIYTTIYNEIICQINEISDQFSKTLNEVSYINSIKKNRKKISISQHTKLKINFGKIFLLILISFILVSIYPMLNYILTNKFLSSFSLNIQENIVFGKLSSSFSLFYAINYFNINYQFYVYQQGIPMLNQTITQSFDLNSQIFDEIISYVGNDLDNLINSAYITGEHKTFLLKLKGDNLCELIDISPEEVQNCSKIYKGQMKLGLIVILKAMTNDFKDIYKIIMQNPGNRVLVQDWIDANNFLELDEVLGYMQPITTLIIDNSIQNFQNFLDLQIALITGLFVFGLSVLVILGLFGFVNLIRYLNELLFNARFLLSVLPMDLIQENSYLLSHLTREFKKNKV